jgi:hypothetical protein
MEHPEQDVPKQIQTDEGREAFIEVNDDINVDDDSESETVRTQRFTITSYGADLSVFDLIRRLGNDLLIPAPFQRKFVWNQKHASRFVESVLLGLPVPGIFVYLKDKKQLIVDGQQRLITLQRFVGGVWDKRTRKQGNREVEVTIPFKLQDVADAWEGKSFNELDKDDRDSIENYLIHTTIFRQDQPKDKDRSIYEVFERINTGGLRLSAHEIRACVSFGEFVKRLESMAEIQSWRQIYGNRSPRLKDEELILRFFAFLDNRSKYSRPMRVFLDDYLDSKVNLNEVKIEELESIFKRTLDVLVKAIGDRLFRPENAINAAVYDAVMVGCATRLGKGEVADYAALKVAYEGLLANGEFQKAYRRATADDESVKTRMRLAIEAFKSVP